MIGWLRHHFLFVLIVAVPTCAALLYYAFIASDVYVCESRFLVRSPQHQQSSGIAGLLQGSGFSHGTDDAYAVRDYIMSRDALRELDQHLDIRKAFSAPNVDWLDRFPGPTWWNRSFEKFFLYYGKHVDVEYDPASSIMILTTRAYTANDAFRMNDLLVELSERLVNTLNDRSRHDLISFADNEVQIASEKAKDASLALLSYRSGHEIFEPDKQAAIQLESVAKIQQELVSSEAELAQLKKISPDNPQISSLKGRIESLRASISSEAAKVTGAQGSFSARAPNYERLALDVEFSDRQLGAALAGLESARAEASQKQLYLERLVQPNLPDKAMEPKRVRSALTVFLICMIGWAVASILIASVREHAD
jgi:capsular polysaccharide transport system permease protein